MIRKSVYIVLLILLGGGSLFSQSEFEPEWAFGVNGGATFSKVSFNPKVSQQNLQQFVGGFSARYLSEKNFGLQAELNFSQRGWQEQKDSIPDHKFTKSLLYLELPVMTHIYFNLGSRVRMVFNLGPQIGFQLSENVKEKNVILDPGYSVQNSGYPVQYELPTQNKFDWGIAAGGGFELRTGIGSFVLEGRYYYGLSDIYKNRKSDYYAVSSNQVLNVKLTYFYRK